MPHIPTQAAQTGGLLLRLAIYLWGVGGRWLRIAIFVAAGALLLILGMALTGIPGLVALTALAPLVALFLVPARINPMWLLAIAVWPDRILVNEKRRVLSEGIPLGGDELRRGVRWVFAFVAVEVGMAFYYAGVEYLAPSVDRTLVLVTFALFVFFALVAASPTGKVRTRTIGVLSVVFVILTVLFLFGGKNEFGDKLEAIGNDDAKAAPAAVAPEGATESQVALRGFGDCSASVDLDVGPSGRNVFLGPSSAVVRWLDYGDEEGPINKWWDQKGGRVCFLGPAGETVTVRQIPS